MSNYVEDFNMKEEVRLSIMSPIYSIENSKKKYIINGKTCTHLLILCEGKEFKSLPRYFEKIY